MDDSQTPDTNDRATYEQGAFLSQLSSCTSVKQYQDRVQATIQQLGFSDFFFAVLGPRSPKTLTTLPYKVRQAYLQNDMVECDLFLDHAWVEGTAILQSAIENYILHCPFGSPRLARNSQHFKLLESLGYHDAFGLPHTLSPDNRRSILILYARNSHREEFKRKVEQYRYVFPFLVEAIAHFGFSKFPNHFLVDARNLNPKPLQMLVALGKEGLKLKEAADKHCISVDTANKHIAIAKQTLGATTTANAIYKAIAQGLIEKDE